jgi:hypothetical protein
MPDWYRSTHDASKRRLPYNVRSVCASETIKKRERAVLCWAVEAVEDAAPVRLQPVGG